MSRETKTHQTGTSLESVPAETQWLVAYYEPRIPMASLDGPQLRGHGIDKRMSLLFIQQCSRYILTELQLYSSLVVGSRGSTTSDRRYT